MASVALSRSAASRRENESVAGALLKYKPKDEEEAIRQVRLTYIFPLFTELVKGGHLPQFVPVVQTVVFWLQLLACTCWTTSLRIFPQVPSGLVKFVRGFADWGVTNRPTEECTLQYALSYVLFLCQVFWLFAMFGWFWSRRSYHQWQLRLFNLVNHVVLSISIAVHGTLCGHAFREISYNIGNNNHMRVLFFTLSLIVWGLSMGLFDLVNQYTSETPILSRSLLAQWDRRLFSFVKIVGLVALCVPSCDAFPEWVKYIGTVGVTLAMSYPLYVLWFLPMVRFEMNSVMSGVIVSAMCGSFLAFVRCFIIFDDVYQIIIPVSVGFVAFLIFSLCIFPRKKKRICEFLSSETLPIDGKHSLEDLRLRRFHEQVFSSAEDVISYIRVGVACHCEMIVDFSFLKYVLEFYKYPELILFVAKASSFFPTEMTFFTQALRTLPPEESLEAADRFLVFQLKRIHELRQTSVSEEATREFQELQKKTKEAISHVRAFWGEILNAKTDISFASLNFIWHTSIEADAAFRSAIDRFPNNLQIIKEYGRFQIEAMGAFSAAITSGKKAIALEQGKMLDMDHAFRSMVNVFPDYLYSGVMDCQGNIKSKGILRENTTAQFSGEALMHARMDQKHHEIISKLFDHGRLRVAVEQKLRSVKMKSLSCAEVISIIQMIVTIIIFLVTLTQLPRFTSEISDFVDCIDSVSKLTTQINEIAANTALQAAVAFQAFEGPAALEEVLGLTTTASEDMFLNMFISLTDSADVLQESLLGTLRQTVESVGNADSFSYHFLLYKRFEATSSLDVLMSVRGSLSYYTYMTRVVGAAGEENPDDPKLPMYYSELIVNALEISKNVLLAQKTIRNAGTEQNQRIALLITRISILVSIIYVILFVICRIYSLLCIIKDRKFCSTLLRGVTPEMVQESYKPIALNYQKEGTRGNQVHTAHEIDIPGLYPWFMVLLVFWVFPFLYVATFVFADKCSKVNDIFSWFEQQSATFLAIMNATSAVTCCACNILTPDETAKRLETSIADCEMYHQLMDVSVIGDDEDIDTLYFRANCNVTSDDINTTSYYDCLSIDNRLNLAKSAMISLHRNGEWQDLNTPEYCVLVYLINQFLVNDLIEVQDAVVKYATRILSEAYATSKWVAISAIILSFPILYFLEKVFIMRDKESIEAVKQLICVLPPLSIVSSTGLMDFILGSKKEESEGNMTAPESLLSSSAYAVILVDNNGIIQAVNSSVNQIFGYTPDQVLGQTIQHIIPENENISVDNPEFDFYIIMRQMLRPNSVETNMSLNAKCRAESDTMIDVKITLLCIRDDVGEPQSFALFLRNISEDMALKEELERAKATAESLVKALLPRDIWAMWDSEDKYKLIKSDSAAVMVIGIGGLDIHTTQSTDLMNTINTVYKKIDAVLQNFPSIRGIKSRHDYFLAVTGLFDNKTNFRLQALDAIGFAMALFQALDDLSEDVSCAALHFKISIDIGGPLAGRILDANVPDFELHGDVLQRALLIFYESGDGRLKVGKGIKDQLDPEQFDIQREADITERQTNTIIEVYDIR